MAWQDNRYRIPTNSSSHRSNGFRSTDSHRLLAVGRSFSKWNRREPQPYFFLKLRPAQIEFDIELGSITSQILFDLKASDYKDRMIFFGN
jgi:hypothetical protein